MMSTTPTLNSQIVGQAHYATRALLERELARTGNTFLQSMTLNATAAQGGTADLDAIVHRLTSSLKIDETKALATVAELIDAELLERVEGEANRVALTGPGRTFQARIAALGAEFGARVYGGIPAPELEIAARVLTEVTARADAVFAETADGYAS
jgi:DNA-binding MarR family transcriptional regulator